MDNKIYFINQLNNVSYENNIDIIILDCNNNNDILYKCGYDNEKINQLIEIFSNFIDYKFLYNVIFLYISYNHNISLLTNIDYIKNFINNHIIYDENNISFKIYKGEFLNIYSGYMYNYNKEINNNIVTINRFNNNISILNNILEYTNNNDYESLFISFITNKNLIMNIGEKFCFI